MKFYQMNEVGKILLSSQSLLVFLNVIARGRMEQNYEHFSSLPNRNVFLQTHRFCMNSCGAVQ